MRVDPTTVRVCSAAFRRAYPPRHPRGRGRGAPTGQRHSDTRTEILLLRTETRERTRPELSEYGPWGRGLGTRFSFRLCVTLRRTI